MKDLPGLVLEPVICPELEGLRDHPVPQDSLQTGKLKPVYVQGLQRAQSGPGMNRSEPLTILWRALGGEALEVERKLQPRHQEGAVRA